MSDKNIPLDELEIKLRERAAELIKTNQQLNQELAEYKKNKHLAEARRFSDIGTLAATVAHELRNPLAAMHMAAYNIRKKNKNSLLDKHLNTIDKKIKESDQIINNLLYYSRLREPQFESVDLYQELEAGILEFQEHHCKGEIVLIVNIDSLKNIFIIADKLQLKEVLHNVLNNACDSMLNQSGKIRISASHDACMVDITITDEGQGIDSELIIKVFDPFFTTKAKGTGLGLAVCRLILSLHHGSIDIASAKGKGTAVFIRLPLVRSQV